MLQTPVPLTLLALCCSGCIEHGLHGLGDSSPGKRRAGRPSAETADGTVGSPDDLVVAPVEGGTVGADTAPDVRVSPSLLDYGTVLEGAAAVRTFEVGNHGTSVLRVEALVLDDPALPFEPRVWATDGLPVELAPGQTVSVDVHYEAGLDGLVDSRLRVVSNDPDEPRVPVSLFAWPCETPPQPDDLLAVPDPTGAGGVALLAYDEDGRFHPPLLAGEPTDGEWHGLQVGDFTGDGLLDVLARPTESGDLVRLSQVCAEQWEVHVLDPALPYLPRGAADLDGDGHLDIYGITTDTGVGYVGRNRGDGTFTHDTAGIDLSGAWSGYASRVSRTAEDIDHDGHLDLLIADYPTSIDTPSRLHLARGRGDGSFAPLVRLPDIPTAVNSIDFVDLDGSGHPDALLGMDDDGDAGRLFVMWNDGEGLSDPELWVDQSGERESGTNSAGAGWIAAFDWDGDGREDLLATFGFYTGADPGERFVELGWHHHTEDGRWSGRHVVEAPGLLTSHWLASPVR